MTTAPTSFGTLSFFSSEIEKFNGDSERTSHIELLEKIEDLQDQTESKDYWDYLELLRLDVIDNETKISDLEKLEITFEDFVSMQPSPMYWETISQILHMPFQAFSKIIGANIASAPLNGSAYAFHLNSSFKDEEQRKAVQEFIEILRSKGDSSQC
jgi:hypothetical protein